ncbi:class II fructose-1,6-bisphosphate aldolase [Loigolactobacillus coryniformis]|jgi:fructose-bisphosphate aldolase class II|uniref:Fructose-bisphosphate aldolase n=3 Tax=Loigolactobacillus coryniformis TaxID=1610 RepID=A0A0R1F817_9LACO|nr:class II fructose-1,6-bisphosphate aldolase [Loigolactobacillus coryniformis]MDT3391291.1 class II fructose-1,6-bisphosphate aldolase [Bacillota bacterium]OEH90606.1 fructose-bisphosphate aldolase [Loigolactobacillus coryniformis subsp. coryniformis]RRG05645.1 MAG: class II fructose-1,6-bisphosphate aldolase [Lactobacillus sp.]ATO44492.1 fructose-1,6-bisphosphate aldolase, class II [Loigolactobacillus coryniformis subsp. torquens DSM 20004 = KCTC 3535]ATO56214.1 fructose-1,6-bisphosphate al
MSLVHGTELFAAARKGHYAIGAFNTNNLEWTRAILGAAQELNVPVLIQTSMGAAKYMGGYELCQQLVEATIKSMNITVPVVMHLDHGNYEAAKAAIAAGYNSVMFDGHDLPFAENLEKTKEIVALAHAKGISVEAEVGSIGGEEDGIVGEGELADVEEAKQLAATGIDFLAAGIGNIHGQYPANWKGLHFDRLQELADVIEQPLVLHGGSGIPQEQVEKAISMGVAKLNINTECQLAFAKATREYIEAGKDQEGKGFDPRKLLAPGTKAIEDTVKEIIGWMGTKPVKLVPEEI